MSKHQSNPNKQQEETSSYNLEAKPLSQSQGQASNTRNHQAPNTQDTFVRTTEGKGREESQELHISTDIPSTNQTVQQTETPSGQESASYTLAWRAQPKQHSWSQWSYNPINQSRTKLSSNMGRRRNQTKHKGPIQGNPSSTTVFDSNIQGQEKYLPLCVTGYSGSNQHDSPNLQYHSQDVLPQHNWNTPFQQASSYQSPFQFPAPIKPQLHPSVAGHVSATNQCHNTNLVTQHHSTAQDNNIYTTNDTTIIQSVRNMTPHTSHLRRSESSYHNRQNHNYQQLNQQWELEIPSTILEEEPILEQTSIQDYATTNTDNHTDTIQMDNENTSTTSNSLQSNAKAQHSTPVKVTHNGSTIEGTQEQVLAILQFLQGQHCATTSPPSSNLTASTKAQTEQSIDSPNIATMEEEIRKAELRVKLAKLQLQEADLKRQLLQQTTTMATSQLKAQPSNKTNNMSAPTIADMPTVTTVAKPSIDPKPTPLKESNDFTSDTTSPTTHTQLWIQSPFATKNLRFNITNWSQLEATSFEATNTNIEFAGVHQQHMENDYPSQLNEQLPSTPQSTNDSQITGVLHSPIVSSPSTAVLDATANPVDASPVEDRESMQIVDTNQDTLLSEGESIQMVKTNLELSSQQEHTEVIHRPPPAPNKFVTPFVSSNSSISAFLRRNHSRYKPSRDYTTPF